MIVLTPKISSQTHAISKLNRLIKLIYLIESTILKENAKTKSRETKTRKRKTSHTYLISRSQLLGSIKILESSLSIEELEEKN